MPSHFERQVIRPVSVRLTAEEARVLVAMRNPCRPGSEEWHLAASARSHIAEALDEHDAFVGRIQSSMAEHADVLRRLQND